MSITQQQPITNLPSSLTPAPVTVVRTPIPSHAPPPQPEYQTPSQNIMHQQQLSAQQQGVTTGTTMYSGTVRGPHSQPPQDAPGFPVQQQQQVSLALGEQPPMSTPQSTPVSSLPGAPPYSQPLPPTYSQPPGAAPLTTGASPQMFVPAGTAAVSGLPAAPPTFSLPSVPPTISLGPTPSLSPSVSAQ